MVVAAFPVAKLGALMLKQVSKPLANLVKRRARNSPFFRNYICMPPAQFYHWCEVKLKMWSMNLGKPINIPKLNEASAIELGAELLGEAIIFTIAAAILLAEYVRSSRKEAQKEAERLAQMEQISNDLRTLYTAKARQEAQIRELIRILEIKIPDSSFEPEPFTQMNIPAHHRDDYHAHDDEDHGAFQTVKGWISSAIDYVLPPVHKPDKCPTPSNEVVVVPHHLRSPEEPKQSGDCGCGENKTQPNDSKPPGSGLEDNNNNNKPGSKR